MVVVTFEASDETAATDVKRLELRPPRTLEIGEIVHSTATVDFFNDSSSITSYRCTYSK